MDTPPASQTWAEQTGRSQPRPRVVIDDHMVVFGVSGGRDRLTPDLGQTDGFDNVDHHIYVATPEEMRPENHEALKAKLAEKIAQAREMPYSPIEIKNRQESYVAGIIRAALMQEPVLAIRHFAKTNEEVRTKFATPERLEDIADSAQRGYFSPYDLHSAMRAGRGKAADRELYLTLKKLFRQHGKEADFVEIEKGRAEEIAEQIVGELPYDHKEHQRIIRSVLVEGQYAQDRPRYAINSTRLEDLHRRLLDESYGDLDAAINKARDAFVERSRENGFDDPFARTDEEKAKIQEIHDIAHREHEFRPVILAGYENPDLAIIINRNENTIKAGVSYGGLGLIVMNSQSRNYPFFEVLQEELLHQAMENIYHNDSLPYQNNDDNRKALVKRAINHDFNDPGLGVLIGFGAIHHYSADDERTIHQEIPVKLMKYAGTGILDIGKNRFGPDAYESVLDFAREVILKDAIAHRQGLPLPAINDDFSRESSKAESHAAQLRKPAKPDWP